MKKETQNLLIIISSFAFIVTLILSMMNSSFISACLLMLSLLLFSICNRVGDSNKIVMYTLFVLGVLNIVLSLGYMFVKVLG